VLAAVARAIAPAPGRSLLDVGGGTGNYAAALRRQDWTPTVVDASPQMREVAAAKDLDVLAGDAIRLPARDAEFDAVTMISMLHQVSDWRRALAEARRVLRPGGCLAVMLLTAEHLREVTWTYALFPSMSELALPHRPGQPELLAELPGAYVAPLWFEDLSDGSIGALCAFPEAVLDSERRRQTSFFEYLEREHPEELETGLKTLEGWLESGRSRSAPRRGPDSVTAVSSAGRSRDDVVTVPQPNRQMFTREFWDERYSGPRHVWSGRPNPQLVARVSDLEPGRALDVGCGEGGDVIWLAERGWSVTGVDISPVGLRRAAGHASEAGAEVTARIQWRLADLFADPATGPAPGIDPDGYDLVNSQYLHLPPEVRTPVVSRLAAAVAPGGRLLMVSHHPSDLEIPGLRPNVPEMFYAPEELAARLDAAEWEIIAAEAPERTINGPGGEPVIIRDTVLFARRRT
jgi:ubiquinone/menaquinone biosynthesis C-methylase UbiE